jgi:lysophospholipase L1-like esterase
MLRSSCRILVLSLLLGCLALAQTISPAARKITIELVGDSTQTDNAGYGLGFCANLTPDAICVNRAQGGASTKTYRADGLWAKALEVHPDWMLIQFGHNDMESPEHLTRQTDLRTEYPANLHRYVREAREHGIQPILVTPLTRRYFGPDGKIHSDLLAHTEAMKKVADEEHVPLLDLQSLSIAYLNRIGEAEGNRLGITKKDARGETIPDKTHLNYRGSYVFGRMVAEGMAAAVPELAKYVKPQAAPLPPEGERSMAILNGAPVKIVLVGDSTVNTGGGWGPGFCAALTPNVTCVNKARNGRSSKSYYNEGHWKEALAERGDYYLIQFGHNDMPGKGPERETDPETTYATNLRRYVAEARAQGARAVIVTSLSRRNYKEGKLVMDLVPYAAAARRVAHEENVPLVDLYSMSTRLLIGMTQEAADAFDAPTHPDAKAEIATPQGPDRTHLNEKGAQLFGRMVADSLIRISVELGPDVKGEPAPAGPSR